MELRTFFPSALEFDLAKRLEDVGVSVLYKSNEERTDHYYNLKDPAFGLKLRGENGLLELKVRGKVEDGVESWQKVLRARTKGTDEEIASNLKKHGKPIDLWTQGNREKFELRKKRVSFVAGGISCEQVSFSVHKDGKYMGDYTSINFEGGNKANLLELQQKVMSNILKDERVWSVGYPEFVMKVNEAHTTVQFTHGEK